MHFGTFIPAFLIFAVLGLVLPVVLSNIAVAHRGKASS